MVFGEADTGLWGPFPEAGALSGWGKYTVVYEIGMNSRYEEMLKKIKFL